MEPIKGPESSAIQKMFSSIAGNYDLANSVLSFGIHHNWKKKLVSLSGPAESVLDCATGTGDLALLFKARGGKNCDVSGCDFCVDMLQEAPLKAAEKGLKIDFQHADVTALPYADQSFDVVSIAFGIRNVQVPSKAFEEMHRVLKPGGRLMVLEFGQPTNAFFGGLYRVYSQKVLPRLGGFITGDANAYRYLEESSSHFPCGNDFLNYASEHGSFTNAKVWPLSGGIAYIYRLERDR